MKNGDADAVAGVFLPVFPDEFQGLPDPYLVGKIDL